MIRAVPAFEDNYIWIIGCDTEAADEVVVVDPGDSAPVLEDLSQRGLKLAAILITHHHRDHIGGIAELTQQAPRPEGQAQIPVYGPTLITSPILVFVHQASQCSFVGIPYLLQAVADSSKEQPNKCGNHFRN